MTVLVTGAAGFIGAALTRRLLDDGIPVVGVDNLDPYYEVSLKRRRLGLLDDPGFVFLEGDLSERGFVERSMLPAAAACEVVFHLAAQAGVRHSVTHPRAYASSNLVAFLEVLEACRRMDRLRHLVYASSSSVYGLNPGMPFRESDPVATPTSLYAATKIAGEAMAHSYAHLHGVKATGLRFFTVYGRRGRPDMAVWDFARRIRAGEPVTLYESDEGPMMRDFTHVDDVVDGLLGVMPQPPDSHRVLNVGRGRPEAVSDLVRFLEKGIGRPAVLVRSPKPPADVVSTWADVSSIAALCGYAPSRDLERGAIDFARWFRECGANDGGS